MVPGVLPTPGRKTQTKATDDLLAKGAATCQGPRSTSATCLGFGFGLGGRMQHDPLLASLGLLKAIFKSCFLDCLDFCDFV